MANEHPDGLLHRGLFRHSPAGSSCEPAAPDGGVSPPKPWLGPYDKTFNFETHKERWMALLRLVHEDYPYCTMYGVHIVDGSISACEQIQRSLMLGNNQPAPSEFLVTLFDMKWQALEALCMCLGTGRLVELKFHDAKPVIAITKEGGRRFKGILKKLSKPK